MNKNVRLTNTIRRAYEIIGRTTPIRADCGELCGAACCKDTVPGGDVPGGDVPGGDVPGGDDADEMRDGAGAGAGAGDVPDIAGAGVGAGVGDRQGGDAGADDATGISGAGDRQGDEVSGRRGGVDRAPDVVGEPSDGAGDVPGEDGVGAGVGASLDNAPDALGMLLFPGEADLLSQETGFRLYRIRYMGSRVWFLVCDGVCDRRKRPLACRIFPLAPFVNDAGAVNAQPDPRARRMCPLAGGEHLDPAFCRAVAKAFRHLAREPELMEFMRLMSEELTELRDFIKYIY